MLRHAREGPSCPGGARRRGRLLTKAMAVVSGARFRGSALVFVLWTSLSVCANAAHLKPT